MPHKLNRIYAMELVRSFQVGEIGRRSFLRKATAVFGSAAIANMVLAACVPVQPGEAPPPTVVKEEAGGEGEGSGAAAMSAAGLTTAMVEYPDADDGETLMGYLARPEDDAPAPRGGGNSRMVGLKRSHHGRDQPLRAGGFCGPGTRPLSRRGSQRTR